MFNMFANYKKTQSKLPKELKTFAKVAKKNSTVTLLASPSLSVTKRMPLGVVIRQHNISAFSRLGEQKN